MPTDVQHTFYQSNLNCDQRNNNKLRIKCIHTDNLRCKQKANRLFVQLLCSKLFKESWNCWKHNAAFWSYYMTYIYVPKSMYQNITKEYSNLHRSCVASKHIGNSMLDIYVFHANCLLWHISDSFEILIFCIDGRNNFEGFGFFCLNIFFIK